jgi:hypothetical protein
MAVLSGLPGSGWLQRGWTASCFPGVDADEKLQRYAAAWLRCGVVVAGAGALAGGGDAGRSGGSWVGGGVHGESGAGAVAESVREWFCFGWCLAVCERVGGAVDAGRGARDEQEVGEGVRAVLRRGLEPCHCTWGYLASQAAERAVV